MSVERRGTKALELWAKKATQGHAGVSVDNMTTAWRNGLAFCALIHHFRPDLIEFDSLKAENILENNALAYRVAEQHLGIPALLDAEDMLESLVPDRLSILTYVSQFYQVFGSQSVSKSPKESSISPSINTSSPLTPQKTPGSSPIIVGVKSKQVAVSSKKETDFKTDKQMTGGFKVKREECQGCQKPVFIAERILVGSPVQLRHRTCFRCARCTAQLTLANYYVTEKGQFCCETCPDEEKQLSLKCSANKMGDETSSDLESDSGSSDSSISASLSSAADQSIASDIMVTPKPRTIFLTENNASQNKSEILKDDKAISDNDLIADNVNRSSILNDLNTEGNIMEEAKPVENSVVMNRLKFFDSKSQIANTSSLELEPKSEYVSEKLVDNDNIAQSTEDESTIDILEGSTVSPKHTNIPCTPFVESSENLETEAIAKIQNDTHIPETSNDDIAAIDGGDANEEINIEAIENLQESIIEESVVKKGIYPDILNPFGSDKEETSTSKTLNPFGSSDEEEDTSNTHKEKCSPKNDNPFWSDDESYLHDFPQTPSKSKSPPPRPPPPTLKRNEVPHGHISSVYAKSFPSSPAISLRSATSDVPTLRIKKKHKPAPVPPALLSRNPQLDKDLEKCLGDNKLNNSREACDEVLSSKIEKDKRNQSSKMNDNITQRDAQVMKIRKFESGEWKRKKGPAPSRPVPQKRVIRALPISQIQQELVDIEVKQTELERQGVIMETLIRSKTEKPNDTESLSGSMAPEVDNCSTMSSDSHPGVEVEDLILQLFELVNEKNELFRRQTELMYLKREKRLEEEHAELEYQIRCSILKPNRTEEETRHEEELIARLMKVVEQRDQIVNCLELERQREKVEDESIATHMIKYQEKYIDGIDSNEENKRKKKKKKLRLLKKKKKKSEKGVAGDEDKDVDETEINVVKKKKKKWFKKMELRASLT